MKSPMAGGSFAAAASVAPPPAFFRAVVFNVNTVEASFTPGVTPAGGIQYVQPLGNPVQLRDTAESNGPNCGVTRIV